jgi:tRNA(fMet)-specific endonuclease VapC
MSLFLIDTNIASFIFKGSDDADPYLPILRDQELALSLMSVAELFQFSFTADYSFALMQYL